MIKASYFSHQQRDLEVRAAAFENEWRVRVFENGRRATQIEYAIMIEATFDGAMNLVDHLMQIAENDVKEERVPLVSPV